MELFEEEVEIYNSKMRLLNWLLEELKIHMEYERDNLNEVGQKLPLNIWGTYKIRSQLEL